MNAKSTPVVLTEKNFNKEVLECPDLVLVEFTARWSGLCKIIVSVLPQLNEEFGGRFKLAVIDIDDCERLGREYHIHSLPTLLFFWRGVVVDNITGVCPRKTVVDKLNYLLETMR